MPPSSAAAATALQNFQNSEVSPQAALDQGNSKYGVSALGSQLDALRSTTSNLQKSIANVDPSVTGRTSGSLVTEAQRQAIVNNEREPLVHDFNDVSTNLNNVDKQYSEATGLASNYANAVLANQKNTYDQLFGQYQTALQKEQADAAAAEKQREFNATLAEQQAARKAAASSGLDLSSLLGGAASAAPSQPSVQDHFNADLQRLLPADYANRFLPGYTERTVIPKLAQLYPEFSPQQVAQMVYAYRKPFEGGH